MTQPESDVATAPWNRRGLLLAVGVLELIACVVAYAGASWAIVVDALVVDLALLMLWLSAGAGLGAAVLDVVARAGRRFPLSPVLRGEGRGGGSGSEISNLKSQIQEPPSPALPPEYRGEGVRAEPFTPALPPEYRGEGVRAEPLTPTLSLGYRGEGGSGSASLWFVTAAALGLGIISLLTLVLGLVGAMSRGVAVGLLAGGVLAGLAVTWRHWRTSLSGDIGAPLRASLAQPAGCHWLWLLLLPLLAIAIVGAYVPPGLLWRPDEPHGYDVVEYHFQVPREWYEAGRIVPLTHNVFSYFPFGVETHYLLAMHLRGGPWKGMYLAQLMHVAHVALSVLAVYGLASSLTKRRISALAATLTTAAVPWLTLLAPIGFNEGGLLLYGALAIGWALRAIDAPPRAALTRFALAGAMAGFACGVKLTAVPMLLVALPVAVVVVTPRLWKGAILFVVIGGILFCPWALRNIAWAGNPVFPEAASVLGKGHFSDVQVERWHRAHSPRADQHSVGARLNAAGKEIVLDWRFGYVPLGLGVAAAALGWRDRRVRALAVLFVFLLIFWLAFTHLQGRFFLLAVPVAAMLVALADWRRGVPAVVAVLVVATLASSWRVHSEFYAKLYGPSQWGVVLGAQDLSPQATQSVPPDALLSLVGEAQAFYYQRPMSRLRYRTVFDIGPSQNVVEGWLGGRRQTENEWLLVSPSELERFANTYWAIPRPPAVLMDRGDPVLIPPPTH